MPVESLMNGASGMKNIVKRLWKEEDGHDLTEYGLLLILVGLGSVTAMGSLGTKISTFYTGASTSLS